MQARKELKFNIDEMKTKEILIKKLKSIIREIDIIIIKISNEHDSK